MKTLTVSHFKNHALQLLDEISTSRAEILITRRGKPLALVRPAKSDEAITLGKLKGTMEITGDIVGPLGDTDWKACQ